MSKCKHEKRAEYSFIPEGQYICYCQDCDADLTRNELDLIERAEKAEAKLAEAVEKNRRQGNELRP